MVIVALLAAIAPAGADAYWVESKPGIWGWIEKPGDTPKWHMTDSQWKATVRNAAAAQVQAGTTGQSAAAAFGDDAAKGGVAVLERVKSAGNAAKGGFTSGLAKVKTLPAISALGTVANAASAFYIGWTIGGVLRNLWVDEKPAPIAEFSTQIEQQYRDEGSSVASSSTGSKNLAVVMPAAGASAVYQSSGGIKFQGLVRNIDCPNPSDNFPWKSGSTTTYVAPPSVEGAVLVQDGPSTLESGCKRWIGFYWIPIVAVNLGMGDGFSGSINKLTAAPSPVNPAAVEKGVEEQFQSPFYDSWVGPATLPDAWQWPGGLDPEGDVLVSVPGHDNMSLPKYKEKLQEEGLVAAPVVAGEGSIRPDLDPESVVGVFPKPGTQIKVGSTVTVQHNPANHVPTSGSSWSPPAIRAVDLSPLQSVLDCNMFPFGVFCWLYSGLTSWSSAASCPEIELPVGTSVGVESGLPFDMCQFEPAMEIIRPLLVLLSLFTLVYVVAAAGLGFGSGGGGNDD